MPLGFPLKPVSGIDFDTDELYKSPQHAAFMKNMCLGVTQNETKQAGTEDTEGDNDGIFPPVESNEVLCPLPLPEGNNYCIGYLESKETNKAFVFVFNDLQNHSIYQIDGYSAYCTFVKISKYLNFKLDPRNFISHGRAVLKVFSTFNKATKAEERREYLIFTDNTPPIKFISVTDALATNGFSTSFFDKDNCTECDLLALGVPTPNSCIGITPVIREANDTRENLISNNPLQIRVKFIDVWGRETEHGIISDLWYSTVGACVKQTAGQPRCLDLTFDSGCAFISQIQIEFRIWNSNAAGELATPSDWYLHETIEKYDQKDATLFWFQRQINPDLKFNASSNKITYRFCADKGTTAIDAQETNRNYNPLPIRAASVFTINKGIGTANHDRDFPPLDQAVLEKIKFEVEKPKADSICTPKSRTISVYGHIMCLYHAEVQNLRMQDSKVVYGADQSSLIFEFQQVLPAGQEGFIGYFAGTNDYVVSVQYRHDKTTGELVEVGLGDFYKGLTVPTGSAFPAFVKRYQAIQKWTFKDVTPGKKLFRVASQHATPSMEYQKTSMNITGTAKFPDLLTYANKDVWEIEIKQCEGDVDLLNVENIILCDLTSANGGTRKITNVVQGYLKEDEVSKIPVEKAWIDAPSHTIKPLLTDHNGFYFAMSDQRRWHVDLFSTKNCQKIIVAGTKTTNDAPGERYVEETLYMYQGTLEYKRTDRIYIKGRVTLLGSPAVGVAGVLVMITGGSTAITNESGYYTIIAHDRGDNIIRRDNVKYAQVGLCQIGRQDSPCSTCFPDVFFVAPGCAGQDRIFSIDDLPVVLRDNSLRGPQNGGRYELAIIPYYNIGQPANAQRLPSFGVDIPTIGETGVYGFSKIKYTITPDILFPLDVKYITIAISSNLNWTNFLTWVGEKVEFVDNTGNVNKVTPSQIKIYYTGLGEYNKRNNFSTNAVWQFTDDTDDNKPPIIGDRVEFVANGDGTLFTARISSLVRYDQGGKYFLINYTDDLKDLKDGVQIKLIRPSIIRNTTLFYEQCLVLPVKNGRIDSGQSTGYLNYFDSYMVSRQIPIPAYDSAGAQILAQSVLKTYSFQFEHHSPSDFWGSHARNIGRTYVVNPYQNKKSLDTEISLSAALVNNGLLNGLSYFDNNASVEYDRQVWGSITAVISEIGYLNVICQNGTFRVRYDDNLIRVRKDNTIEANSAENRLGRPEPKSGEANYGCNLNDINTIRELDGVIMFLDRTESALVVLKDGQSVDVSANGFKGWLRSKIKHAIQNNELNNGWEKYFHGGFDPKSKDYLLTMFGHPSMENPFKGTGTENYINQLREKQIEASETIAYNPFMRSLKQMLSYTPEYYGSLSGQKYDMQLFSFKQGQAWVHHKKSPGKNKSYLNFYGEPCEAVVELILNIEPRAIKKFQYVEVMCKEQQFFADRILTESGQESRILKANWDKTDSFWKADFKMDLTTRNDINIPALQDENKKIWEGNPLTGKWVKVRLVARDNKYFEFDGINIGVFKGEKSGVSGK